MIKISNVSVTINDSTQQYSSRNQDETRIPEPSFTLNVTVSSNTREFLELVAQAVHKELANPGNHMVREQGKVGSTFSPGMGT